MRSRDGGIEIEPFLATLPTSHQEAARLRTDLEANPLYAGSLVSNDGRTTSIVLYLNGIPLERFIDEEIDLSIERIARAAAPEMQVLLTGSPHIRATTTRRLRRALAGSLPQGTSGGRARRRWLRCSQSP